MDLFTKDEYADILSFYGYYDGDTMLLVLNV